MSGSFYRPIKETASPCVAASPLQSPLPAGTTPAAKAAAHAHESRPAIGAPSAAGGRLDRTEILCCAGDVIGAARGLRIGGRDRRSRKGERDRQGKLLLRIIDLLCCRCAPHFLVLDSRRPHLTCPVLLVHVHDCKECAPARREAAP